MSVAFRYSVTIEWSDEDHAYTAHVPELPGCSAHGTTYEQALEEIGTAMGLWLDVARERGRPYQRRVP
jgi:predicted RNase H-like HicB family nuclease